MLDQCREWDYVIQYCACANIRKAARIVTQLYDRQMQATGLKVTQYYMLVNIARHREISISKLGEVLLLDQSTVTRNVNILKKSGYVQTKREKNDTRTKIVSITPLGLAKLEEATPIWLQIQQKVESRIGKAAFMEWLEIIQRIKDVQTDVVPS